MVTVVCSLLAPTTQSPLGSPVFSASASQKKHDFGWLGCKERPARAAAPRRLGSGSDTCHPRLADLMPSATTRETVASLWDVALPPAQGPQGHTPESARSPASKAARPRGLVHASARRWPVCVFEEHRGPPEPLGTCHPAAMLQGGPCGRLCREAGDQWPKKPDWRGGVGEDFLSLDLKHILNFFGLNVCSLGALTRAPLT